MVILCSINPARNRGAKLLYGHEVDDDKHGCGSPTRVQTKKQTVTGEATSKLVLFSRWLQPEDVVAAVRLSEGKGGH